MAYRHVITAAFAVLFLAALPLWAAGPATAPTESTDQRLIRALLGHETHWGGVIFFDEFSKLPPEQAEAARQKLVLADVQAALAAGASPNAKAGPEVSGSPALTIAASRGYGDIVDVLLAKGASVQATDQWGNSILQDLWMDVPLPVVQKLVLKGANVNVATGRNVSPFRWFIELGRADIVEFMLQHGAEANRRNPGEETPLMTAAHRGRLEVVRLLLRHGANVQAQDTRHATAMTYAALNWDDNTGVFQCLQDQGLSVNGVQGPGASPPLTMAAGVGNVTNVRWLLAHGADVNARDGEGITALKSAERGAVADPRNPYRSRACSEIVRLLQAGGAKS